jgi:hypothetical protein
MFLLSAVSDCEACSERQRIAVVLTNGVSLCLSLDSKVSRLALACFEAGICEWQSITPKHCDCPNHE